MGGGQQELMGLAGINRGESWGLSDIGYWMGLLELGGE